MPTASSKPMFHGGFGSIGNKMLAALVFVAVLPAVTVAVYALRKGTQALAAQALTLLVEAATVDAQRAQDELAGLHEDLRDMAQTFRVEVSDLLDPRRTVLDAGPIRRSREQQEDLSHGLGLLVERLRSFMEHEPACRTALFFVNADLLPFDKSARGQGLLRLDRQESGIEVKNSLHWNEAHELLVRGSGVERRADLRTRQALLEDIAEHRGRAVHRATVPPSDDQEETREVFATEFRNSWGRTVGRLVLTLSWTNLLQELRVASAKQQVGDNITHYRATLYDATLQPLQRSSPTAVQVPESLREAARLGHAGATLTEAGEIVSCAPFHPVVDDASKIYLLAFSRPASKVLESVARFRSVFASILVAALLLTLGLGTYVSRRLTKPLRVVRDGARSIGRGHLRQTLKVRTGDEVEELAREFNAMAEQLRSLYQGMEDTIQQRTEQLQQALDDLRSAHQTIVESEARYSDIVENATDMIQVLDVRGRILGVNRRAAERLGVSVEELTGQDFFTWVAADMRDGTRRAFASVLEGETLRSFVSALLLDGEQRRVPVEVSATPIVRGGRCEGVRAFLRDISERKEMEAQLIKAERLSSVGALAAGVAHEVNNPLGIITMFAQRVLERARKGEVDTEKLETIVEQARRVAKITTGLLDFSRAGPTDFQPFTLESVIRDTTNLVQERARRNEIELSLQVAQNLPRIHGNSQQIGQVLLNLLLNAIQAIGERGRIDVTVDAVDESRLPGRIPGLRVRVLDTGPGISEEVLPHLFEPFFTTKEAGEGTGLGLSVSYGIIKNHQGRLWADNQPQRGVCFSFDLPIPGPGEEAQSHG